MSVDYGNVVRRARNELQRLRNIEQEHAAGRHGEVNRLLAGCDPKEIDLLAEQLAELTFILRSSKLMGAESLETFLDWYREFRQIDGGSELGGGRQGTADGVAPAPEQHSGVCSPSAHVFAPGNPRCQCGAVAAGSNSVAPLSLPERLLLREIRSVGP